jgi:hypothetical protein
MSSAARVVDAIERALFGAPVAEVPPPWLGWLAVGLCRRRAGQGDDQGPTIAPEAFAHGVGRLEPRPVPEARLLRWLPGPGLIVAGLEELQGVGITGHPGRDHAIALSDRLEALHPRVAAVDFADPAVLRAWAAHLNDPELTGGDPAAVLAELRGWLNRLLSDRQRGYELLPAVGSLLPPEELTAVCEAIIEGGVDAATGRAIEVLGDRPGPASPVVDALLDRLDPDQHHPYSAWAAARYLLERSLDHQRALETAEAFARVPVVRGYRGNPMQDRLAILMLEHAPQRALPLVRLALRSSTPGVLQPVASLLARIAQPWCHRELEAALADPVHADLPEQRRVLAAALARIDTDIAKGRARSLAPPVPERTPGAIGHTFDEVVAANLDAIMDAAQRGTGELAARLRASLPPDFGDDWNG